MMIHMSNDNTHAPDLDALLGDDTQDPSDHFLLRDGEQDDDTHGPCDDDDDGDGPEDSLTDVEADAMTLASAGMGTDEDYGCYGGDGDW